MSSSAIYMLATSLGLLLVGLAIMRLAGLSLPRSRSFREFVQRQFYIYPPGLDRRLVTKNRVAGLVLVILIYVIVTSLFMK